jgi:probable rRNA maturation factor
MDPNRSQTTPETPGAEANREDEGTGRISVQVDEPFAAEIDAMGLARAAEAALLAEGDADSEVSLVVTSDEVLAELNRRYRGVEGPTDVLSFAARESAPGFVSAPEADKTLGDVLIALPFVRRQAAELGRDLDDELRLLVVHGTLHLLGYDHAEPDEEAEMWARQDEILAGLT